MKSIQDSIGKVADSTFKSGVLSNVKEQTKIARDSVYGEDGAMHKLAERHRNEMKTNSKYADYMKEHGYNNELSKNNNDNINNLVEKRNKDNNFIKAFADRNKVDVENAGVVNEVANQSNSLGSEQKKAVKERKEQLKMKFGTGENENSLYVQGAIVKKADRAKHQQQQQQQQPQESKPRILSSFGWNQKEHDEMDRIYREMMMDNTYDPIDILEPTEEEMTKHMNNINAQFMDGDDE